MAPSPVAAKSRVKRRWPVLVPPGGQKRAKHDDTPVAGGGVRLSTVGTTPEAKLRDVVEALLNEALESPGIPMAAREMLAEGSRPWLGNVTGAGLHELQELLLGQIRETFSLIASGMESNAEDKVTAVEIRTSELMGLEAQLQGASNVLSQADAQLEARREKVLKAEEKVKASQASDLDFKLRHKVREKEVQVHQNDLKYYVSVEEGLKTLVDGTCPAKDQKKACDKFMKELQKLSPEPSLISSLPMVLTKKPEERKSFDHMVLGEVKDVLRKAMEAVQSKLDAAQELADHVKQEANSHTAVTVKLSSDLEDENRELQQAEELRKDRAAAIASLKTQADNCRNLLGISTKSSEASKAIRDNFAEVQEALEGLVFAAYSLEEVDATTNDVTSDAPN
mmetsp:Transcript_73234/g.145252  ORF Transcript_73234/g.145252 Transcript_73234/m.145252 type:complete len:395 (-) Transcript_73234:128-1312(-)